MNNSKLKLIAGAAFAAVVVGFIGVKSGLFASVGLGGPSLVGRWADVDGSSVEFLKNGTAIIVIRGTQAIWNWSTFDGNRLKLEPTPGVPGPPPSAVCGFELTATKLNVTDCPYRMRLNRI
ncbi:hypothetical protein [Agrobacterium burrii]